MRRFVAGLSVAAVMLLATQAAADVVIGLYASYLDTFSSGTYSGSDGTILWSTSWKESGEADGPSAGAIQVEPDANCPDGSCVVMSGKGGTELVQLALTRAADLSLFSEADLSYEVRRLYDVELMGEVRATLDVQITKDGKTWKTIKRLNLDTIDPAPLSKSHGIDDYLTASFAVRFVVQGSLAGQVLIENVGIKGELDVPTTTLTTFSTTTSSTSTSSTTTSSTTTTLPTTTTTEPSTTTTLPEPSTTTTTVPDDEDDDNPSAVVPASPPTSGLRESTTGLQANFETSLFGDMESPEVLSFEVTADYLIAYEAIESSWVWVAGLSALIAWAIVSNMDRRRPVRTPPADDA